MSFGIEAPVRRLVGSGRLNPLPHSGTISSILLIVVVVTGIYVTLFYEFGFDASYRAIEDMSSHPIHRLMRGLHRYSSAALVLTTLVHAWRIFAAKRYSGPRRFRWLTGWSAIGIVFLAGVTGYWLLWDERAQLLNEATALVLDSVGLGTSVVTSILTSTGTGWQVLVLIWLAHILTTFAIAFFLWRHLRRSRLPWLPPRLWTALMIGALLVVSVLFPVELLGPAAIENIVRSVPIDPFFLFLLPAFGTVPTLLVVFGVLVLGTALALIPWLGRRRPHPVVTIDDQACTGCELCVFDCPYLALEMADSSDGSVAVVDPRACVGCGICIGSCVFDAIELEGVSIPRTLEFADGADVVLACQRHAGVIGDEQSAHVVPVLCAGVISPMTITRILSSGAGAVQVIGCAPADCTFGVGNVLAEERIAGERRPRVPRRSSASTTRDFVVPTAVDQAITGPGLHPSADPGELPEDKSRVAATAGVVLGSMLLVALATTVIFTTSRPESALLVVVHHQPGSVLSATGAPSGAPGTPSEVVVTVGDETTSHLVGGGGLASALLTYPMEAGEEYVSVLLVEGDQVSRIVEGEQAFQSDRRVVVEVSDLGATDAERGEEVFFSSAAGCSVCHSVEPGVVLVGPNLSEVGDVAATRVPGQSADDYLHESIIDPDAYVVDGYPSGQMLDDYEERLSSEDIDALVAYMLTLKGESS